MNYLYQIQCYIDSFLDLFLSFYFMIFGFLLIVLYNLLLYFLKDKKYIKTLEKYKDPNYITIEELKELPLVNIIVPAWKEGNFFKTCLDSIINLKYPNLKVVVNAGGNEETKKIAESFRNYDNFTILQQKPGGKMKALNECLNFISEGIIYSTDADIIITDEILLRMIYPIINQNEYVVVGGVRPLKFQQNNSIVKYLLITRNRNFKIKFSRYGATQISGPNTCFKYELFTKIGRFQEDNYFEATDRVRGPQILSKGFKIYQLRDYGGTLFTYYPDSLKEYILQELRWRENALTNPYSRRNFKHFIKNIISILLSLYIIVFPVLIFFNLSFIFIGILILFNNYLNKLRKVRFFKLTVSKKYYKKFGLMFFIKTIFYIYIDALITIFVGFNIILHKVKSKHSNTRMFNN